MVRIPASSLARHALAVLTAALGLAALRNPSLFGLGMVTMMALAWFLVAGARAVETRGADRRVWIGFAAAMGTSLAVSFGPWSDATLRRGWPDPSTWQSQQSSALPITRLLVGLMPAVRPEPRAEIRWTDARTGVRMTTEVRGPFDSVEGADAVRDQVARIIPRLPLAVPEGQTRVQAAAELLKSSLSMEQYQSIGHILAAVGIGGLVGWGLRLMGRSSSTLEVELTSVVATA